MKRAQALILVLWFLAVALGMVLDRWHESQFLPPESERTSDDILIDVFGEFKTVVARYLWFRMDLFHEVLDDQGVPPQEQDEVLPLLRMVTLLDPSMVDSYDQIVWDLYKGHGDLETAREVLAEGIQRNPKDYQLNFRKALLHHLEGEHLEAIESASSTLPLTQDEFKLADCLRIIYWSSKSINRLDLQRKAAADLLRLRPNDRLWLRENAKLNQ